MVKFKKGKSVSRPSSALGLMSFSDTSVAAPQITPEIMVVITVAFAALILILKIIA